MLLVLVLTVASLVVTDAGYQYDVPSANFGLSSNQPANFHPIYSSQYHTALPNEPDKRHLISYKDYVYLKQDNGHYTGNHGSAHHGTSNSRIVATESVQPTASFIENNEYVSAGYAQNYAPVNNHFNSDHIQNLLPITSNANVGLSQTVSLSGSITSAGNSLSTSYSQSSLASAVNNLNNGYTHSSVPPVSTIIDNAQINTSSNNPNLNTEYSNDWVPINSGFSHGHANAAIPTAGSNLNTGYSQLLAPSEATSYSQSSAGSSNLNIGFTQTGSNNNYNENTNVVSESNSVATVFKHIYFHVPPAEREEENVRLPPPVKKNYKILFIKVPSQESNSARLKQLAQMSNAAASVEHKTLIYVLAKSPESQQSVFIPNRTPSEHEVFFVKYNGDPLDIAAQVNAELDKTGTVQSVVPLESDLENRQK